MVHWNNVIGTKYGASWREHTRKKISFLFHCRIIHRYGGTRARCQAVNNGSRPSTDNRITYRGYGPRLTWLVQYGHSMTGAKLCANTVNTRIKPILTMKLILLKVHFSCVCEFEFLVLLLDILSRVEFHGESESKVNLTFQRHVFVNFLWGKRLSFGKSVLPRSQMTRTAFDVVPSI
jgi:hypothetical protein